MLELWKHRKICLHCVLCQRLVLARIVWDKIFEKVRDVICQTSVLLRWSILFTIMTLIVDSKTSIRHRSWPSASWSGIKQACSIEKTLRAVEWSFHNNIRTTLDSVFETVCEFYLINKGFVWTNQASIPKFTLLCLIFP